MPLTLRDHLKRDGWIPLTSFHRNQAIVTTISEDHRHHPPPLKPSVKALKDLIEDNPDLYMGFTQMFKEAGPASLVGGVTISIYIFMMGF